MLHQRGFNLIEALISVLVLTIGLLGVARLQASLWVGSNELHGTAEAQALCAGLIEQQRSAMLPGIGAAPRAATLTLDSGTTFSTTVDRHQTTGLDRIQVSAEWLHRDRAHRILLHDTLQAPPPARDVRWLLQ